MQLTQEQCKALMVYHGTKAFARLEEAKREGFSEAQWQETLEQLTAKGLFKRTKNGQLRTAIDYWQAKALVANANGNLQADYESAKRGLQNALERLEKNTCVFNARDLGESVAHWRMRVEKLGKALKELQH